MASFAHTLSHHGVALQRENPTWLQINVGKRCNQACRHCHVDAGPTRTEMMTGATIDQVLAVLARNPSLELLDITGGAPELNPHFRRLVRSAHALGRQVIDRCNLTVLLEPGQEDTAQFLAQHNVKIIASLPCYGSENVDRQRGQRVFDRSITALRRLNALGYGQPESGLTLDLVYNPVGAFLPPTQATLQQAYTHHLYEDFGVRFNTLLTITNMPIARFADDLRRDGQADAYMELLVNAFNPHTIDGLMCRQLISVSWDGSLYDCDFNQMLDMPVRGIAQTLWDLDDVRIFADQPIAIADHCFGCTAGAGSSCGGALS